MMSMLCIRSSEKKVWNALPNGNVLLDLLERENSREYSLAQASYSNEKAGSSNSGPDDEQRRSARAPVILAGFQDRVFSLTT